MSRLKNILSADLNHKLYLFKKIYMSILLGALFLFPLYSCTGLNLRTWPFPISPNTHPVSTYSEGGVFFKGGFFYHTNSSVMYLGEGKLEKLGKSCSHSFLYLIAYGSSRIYDAKVNGAISNIGMIEEEVLAILGGVFHRHCTIVKGESK